MLLSSDYKENVNTNVLDTFSCILSDWIWIHPGICSDIAVALPICDRISEVQTGSYVSLQRKVFSLSTMMSVLKHHSESNGPITADQDN